MNKLNNKTILVTGGTGYIGAHTVVELIQNGYDVVIVDNLSNSSKDVLNKIKQITGVKPQFIHADIRNEHQLYFIFESTKPSAVIHFAGLKAVGESVINPLLYYDNNIIGTISLLKAMTKYNCNNLIFSSSATVYGKQDTMPINENAKLNITNPYGATKLHIEQIIKDLCVSNKQFAATILRYFNPIGAHESGLIGDNPNNTPNNLMPRIIDVAKGKADKITIFGNDYDTEDGTGVRDYIHVVDLAKGHIKALEHLSCGVSIYNLGTGVGYSVLQIVDTFNRINNQNVQIEICERRPGDVAQCYSDPTKANNELQWKAEINIEQMCKSAWKYAENN